MRKVGLFCLTVVALLGASTTANAQLPANFPGITVSNYVPGAVAEGYVFLAVASETPGIGTYLMILQNDGTPVWYREVATKEIYDFKMLPNGYLSYAPWIEGHSFAGGGDVVHEILDKNYNLQETITGGNGYVAESHDFQLLPNGNVLQFGYYRIEVDMSQIVPGGHPAALVAGAVVQELDSQRNVVFQWRTWDHTTVEDYFRGLMNDPNIKKPVINGWHLNTINLDNDGHILVATPQAGANLPVSSGWVKKLNRQTGETIWHLGGTENQFTFVGVTAAEGLQAFSGHAFHRLENGNFLIYDNGNTANTRTSKVYEFSLDEANKIATYVWSYVPATQISGSGRGNAQRLPNGNTFIGWGATGGRPIPACTEVTPAGQKVFEIYFTNSLVESYRAFRFAWPPTNKLEFTCSELVTGNTYVFTGTGVTLDVQAGGGDYNDFTVTREPYAPVDPIFPETAPRTLPLRVKMNEANLPGHFLTARISFDAVSFGFSQPTNLTIYYRPEVGQGIFLPQTNTTYNPATSQLRTTIALSSAAGDMGEFIFCYPDLPDVAYAPLLAKPENYRGIQTYEVIAPLLAMTGVVYTVNQQLPISLSWSPKGMARWYEFEIATNQNFVTPVVQVTYQTVANYVWSNALPNMTYFYRVRTQNDAGASDWSVGSFQTVAPLIQVTAPNGGEAWQRGLKYFIQWNDNLAESVVIDLYKSGAFLKSLATNSSAGAYQWEVGLDLVPGNDYSIRVSSATNPSLNDSSAMAFSIADIVPVTFATAPAGLTVTVDGTNYTAPAIFNWLSGSPHTVGTPSPQTGADVHTRYAFNSWSDSGAQSHAITAPFSTATYTATFSTQYQLDITITPSGTGTVTNNPPGPWYDADLLVSLTANTNVGYKFYAWSGVDSQSGKTAQVAMGSYRSVIARFVPANFPTLVITSNGPVAPGSFIGTMGKPGNSTICYNVVLDNAGVPIYSSGGSSATPLWRAVTPCGFIAEKGTVGWDFRDETFAVKDSFTGSINGHDVDILPNGHTLVLTGENVSVDMSQYFLGGRPDAVISSAVIQEIDANKQVVFQWRAMDHIPITDSLAVIDGASVDLNHINTIALDPLDNNYLISLRTLCQIVKVSRITGEIIWRLGGKHSDFTFIGEHPENAPYYFIGEHQMHRLINGNLLFFDNGTIQMASSNTPTPRTYSRVVEYHLDEVNMTATLVWEYRHSPADVFSPSEGSVQRFRNGNTLVGWFSAAQGGTGPVLTEINTNKEVVFELSTPGFKGQCILIKKVWNTQDLIHGDTHQDIVAGQTYAPVNSGVSVAVNTLSGTTPNQLVVQRHDDAVRLPKFPGKAPQVLMEHVTLAGTNINTLAADLSFDLPPNDFCFDTPLYQDPANLTIYQRATVGQGVFTPLTTVYDENAKKLKASTTQLGEFIFTYPDLPEIPLAPILFGQATQASVNQAQPVVFQWTPKGFVSSYHLQVATDAGFSSLVVDQASLTNMTYTLASLQAGTNYYWRVNVSNNGGTGDWATASFTTVSPMVLVTTPNGGQSWQRGLKYFIQWNDNLAESVVIDLYKSGAFLKSLATNSSAGAYEWEVGLDLVPSNDYAIRVRSSTNVALFDVSDAAFGIDAPLINAGSVTRLSDGRVQFGLTAPGAATATVLGSTNLTIWEALQTVPVTSGSAVFTDDTATNYPARFYRVRVP